MTQRDHILRYMAEFATAHHNAPSTRQVAQHFDRAQQTVYCHMRRLIAEKRLELTEGGWKLVGAQYVPPPFS